MPGIMWEIPDHDPLVTFLFKIPIWDQVCAAVIQYLDIGNINDSFTFIVIDYQACRPIEYTTFPNGAGIDEGFKWLPFIVSCATDNFTNTIWGITITVKDVFGTYFNSQIPND